MAASSYGSLLPQEAQTSTPSSAMHSLTLPPLVLALTRRRAATAAPVTASTTTCPPLTSSAASSSPLVRDAALHSSRPSPFAHRPRRHVPPAVVLLKQQREVQARTVRGRRRISTVLSVRHGRKDDTRGALGGKGGALTQPEALGGRNRRRNQSTTFAARGKFLQQMLPPLTRRQVAIRGWTSTRRHRGRRWGRWLRWRRWPHVRGPRVR